MILFQDNISTPGYSLDNALAWVSNCNIDGSRTLMSGEVRFSPQSLEPSYQTYYSKIYTEVPFDSEISDNPAAQFYEYLMTLEDFEGGVPY